MAWHDIAPARGSLVQYLSGFRMGMVGLSRHPLLWLNVTAMFVLRLLGQGFTLLRVLVSDFYYQWAMIYARWGQPTRALWYFNRAVTMNSGGSKVYYNRGMLFLAIGAPERAIGDFSMVIQNSPPTWTPESAEALCILSPAGTSRPLTTWSRRWPWEPTATPWSSRSRTPG